MNILLTNDDGYKAEGIKLLKSKLSKFGRVVIVAPSQVMSGKSCSIVFTEPVDVIKIEDDVYSMNSTPADCVSFGLSSLDIAFDMVVSGCNNGANISYDVIYSGTIGACLQALTYSVPTIAVSCECNFEIVDKYFDDVFAFIQKHSLLSDKYLLNINFPLGNYAKKIAITELFYRNRSTFYVKQDGKYQALRDFDTNEVFSETSDCYCVNNQIISITPLNRTYFSKDLFLDVKKKAQQ